MLAFAQNVLVRWLVPVVTVVALLGQSIGTFAAAGIETTVACCCPSVDSCGCHDHDQPAPANTMKRCNGAVDLVVPSSLVATAAMAPSESGLVELACVTTHAVVVIPDSVSSAPEKPPF